MELGNEKIFLEKCINFKTTIASVRKPKIYLGWSSRENGTKETHDDDKIIIL